MTASVKTIWTALLLLMGAGGSVIAWQSAAQAETPAVRLEPHDGKTQFSSAIRYEWIWFSRNGSRATP